MTDKMLARRDGAIGHMIFNQPEKRNAVSLTMWERAVEILDEFAADPEVRVVVLSGYPTRSAADEALRKGADEFLLKPVDYARLRKTVSAQLGRVPGTVS